MTLSSQHNFQEIPKFIEEKMTTKNDIVVWNYDHIIRVRLETDPDVAPGRVLGTGKYEDSVSGNLPASLDPYFPFEIVNLDFTSQNPSLENGRIEKEILSVEHTIAHHKAKDANGFVLIYTTIIDNNNLDFSSIISKSNQLQIHGWSGLSEGGFNQTISICDEKIGCIENILQQFCQKYEYDSEFKKIKKKVTGSNGYIYSIAGILKKR